MIKGRKILYLCAFAILTGCETFDPEIEIPTYIYVKPFQIDTVDVDLDIFSTKIIDVWLYLDESHFQGAYELPAIIPIAEKDKKSISLRAGIKNAGISNQRSLYPFYKKFTVSNFRFTSGVVDTISPVTKYDNESAIIKIAWEEQFENVGTNITYHPASDTVVERIIDPSLVFRGAGCGGIFLDSANFFFEMISPSLPDLPRSNAPVYMELNYRCNHEFVVGMYTNFRSEQFSLYVVKEKSDWNKIYLDFTEVVQRNNRALDYNVFIGIRKKYNEGEVEMYIDNLKLLHY